jgi:hypothetical protein
MGKKSEESEGIDFNDFVIGDNFEETLDIAGESKKDEIEDEDEKDDQKDEDIKDEQDNDDGGDDNDNELEDDDDDQDDDNDDDGVVDDDDNDETEEDSLLPLIQAIHQHNGWEFDEESFEDGSMDGLMNFIGEVIDVNSRPEYASQESARFDEFVRRYGPEKASEYLQANFGDIDYESAEFDDDDSKKDLYRNYLRDTTKFSDKKIEKEVAKAEELGELDDEENITEYKEHMIEAKAERAKAIEENAEKERQRRYQDYQNYLSSQKDRIVNTEEIAGHTLTQKEKDDFYRFAYEVGKDGKTGYQRTREADKDLDLKLLWSAYMDSNDSKYKKRVESNVTKKVKKNLSRFTDKNSKKKSTGTGRASGKKGNPNSKVDYNDFVLNR